MRSIRVSSFDGVDALTLEDIPPPVAGPGEVRIKVYVGGVNFPELLITASCDVLPEMKEYERTSTTVVNAYLLTEMRRYLANLTHNLAAAGMTAPLLVVASSGGMMRVETASEIPVFVAPQPQHCVRYWACGTNQATLRFTSLASPASRQSRQVRDPKWRNTTRHAFASIASACLTGVGWA